MAQLTPGNKEFIYAPALLNAHWNEKGEFEYVLPEQAASASPMPLAPIGTPSADGIWTALNEGDRLWVETLDEKDSQRQEISDSTLTYTPTVGQSDVVWGQAVHRNEFGIEGGLFWSPSGHRLAFYRMDQSMVQSYPLVQTDEREATVVWMKYPMAGMTSHQVKLGIYDPDTQRTIYLKTGSELPSANIPADHLTNPYLDDHKTLVNDPEHYLTCVTWRPDGRQIFVAELNRMQNYMELNVYDTTTGEYVETLFTLTDAKYVEPEHQLYFLPGSNDRFIWQDERNGYNHLYLYDLGKRGSSESIAYTHHIVKGLQGQQLTHGNWLVTELIGADPKASNLFFMATKDSPIESNLYSVPVKGGVVRRLTTEPGVHRVMMSPDYTRFYDVYSNHQTPRICQTVEVKTGKRKVLMSALNPFDGYARPSVEVGTILAADGKTPLYYRLVKPAGCDKAKAHSLPAIVYLYNGPHAQLVTEGYQFGLPGWDCYMAQQGYVVFTIDGRGSANRGLAFEQAIWHNLGDTEGKDQMQGVAYLKSLPYVDAERIGIYGWSYGGFMATYMKLHYPKTFKVAVAGGPVLDWSRYEVMYGERYMGNTENNAAVYRDNAQINHTDLLQGHLLLIHDDQDATVVPQMSIQFLNNAMKVGHTYPDFYLYPNHPHNVRGIDRIHLHNKIVRYFEDYL